MAGLAVDVAVALPAFTVSAVLEAEAETLALVGPSGAGKTTVLRAIAGLRRPDRGRVTLDGVAWTDTAAKVDLPPERRSVGYVFQDYALFPHLSARANVAFGRGAPERVDELLRRFGIDHLGDARPGRLSGGERQRVALARALARDPQALLLDEPLSALDTDTRLQVRTELADLLRTLRLPTVLVTHDHRDALALADRIGVLVGGRLLQVDTAAGLVAAPQDPFVVTFTGGDVVAGDAADTGVALPGGATARGPADARGPVRLGAHPWNLRVGGDAQAWAVEGRVESTLDDGGRTRVRVGGLSAFVSAGEPVPERGSTAVLRGDADAIHVFA